MLLRLDGASRSAFNTTTTRLARVLLVVVGVVEAYFSDSKKWPEVDHWHQNA